MAFRPFFEVKNIIGDIIGKDLNSTRDDSVQKWINSYLAPSPETFVGTQSDLANIISSQSDSCAEYIKKDRLLTSRSTARGLCQAGITKAYSDVLTTAYGEAYNQQQEIETQAKKTTQIIFFVGIFLLIIFLITKI